MKKLLFIAGTRPEVIKLAPVIQAARTDFPTAFRADLLMTGQHRELADEMLTLFRLQPVDDLRCMDDAGDLGALAARVLERVSAFLRRSRPDMVVVQGDTTTTVSAAWAAFQFRIPVAHVEAGLRSFDRHAPFPEEINRRIVSEVADWHFSPTEGARENLVRSGVSSTRIVVTGNTIVDALEMVLPKAGAPELPGGSRIPGRYALLTTHRRESFGEGLAGICRAVRAVAQQEPGLHWILPVHLNPNVSGPVRELLGGLPNVHLLPPVGYPQLLGLIRGSAFVATDSGGVQEEAPSLGKFCFVLRDVTERPEGIAAGWARLTGTSEAAIVRDLIGAARSTPEPPSSANPYGDGKASARILSTLEAS